MDPQLDVDGALDAEIAWLREFESRCGRPFRVLHIGNIANNAYLNATFLRRVGIDCHVLCYDYYDPMATPEWEAEGGRLARQRPAWFVQGPQRLCLPYLHALLREQPFRQRFLRVRMRAYRALVNEGRTRRAGVGTKQAVRRLRLLLALAVTRLSYARSWTSSLIRWGGRRTARALGFDVPEPMLALAVPNTAPHADAPIDSETCHALRKLELVERFAQLFPERRDRLAPTDFFLWGDAPRWAELFARYDVVQCYATDPILGLLSGTRPYVAYEHGTLRDFTLGDDPVHRLNALAYREADHVFITNGDCLAYAERLGIERYSPMIHPVDVDQHERAYPGDVGEIRRRVAVDVVLLCPLRHDWAIKGTDVHIRALPAIIASTEKTVKLLLCEWGAELGASHALIEELGVADHVEWLPPLDRHGLITHLQAADVLLDQMALPHFGATAPQGLAAGVPVVMSYEPESTTWIVGEPAPILPAFDPPGVAHAVATALDPEWRSEFRERARAWVHRHHHPKRLVLEHCRVYRRLTEERE